MKKEFTYKINAVAVGILLLISCQQVLAQPRQVPIPYPESTKVNFVRTWDAIAPEQDPNAFITRPLKDVKQATVYLDGLGRPIQTVIKQGSMETGAAATDMVSPVEYDVLGREQFKYLPFAANTTGGYPTNDGKFRKNPFQQQETFMNAQYGSQNETYFYSKTNFEASPLSRVTDSYAPGNSWVGSEINAEAQRRNVQMKYFINTLTDAVRIWTVSDINPIGQFETYATSAAYPAGELYKNITIDENKKQVIEFKDKEGKVILKKVQLTAAADNGTGSGHADWLCTYYIYDDLGNLRCVIQPEGVKLLQLPVNNWQLSGTLLAEQCFRYEYDQRNRMIIKKVPGAGEVYMVYDGKDRMVMTQDANMRQEAKWMITKYDLLNRPTETGLWNSNSPTFSVHLSTAYTYTTEYPTTTTGYEKLTLTHYEDYIGLPSGLSATYLPTWNGNFSATSNNWPYPQMPTQSSAVKGMPTWSQVKVLGTTNTFLYTVTIYDDKGMPIQVQSTNITGGIDVITTQYSWAGQPLVTVQKQDKQGSNAQISVVVTQMTYDDLARVIKVEKKLSNPLVNNNAMSTYKTILQNEYDQLGQLKKKSLGSNNLETLSYDYNIRGWTLGVNRLYAKDAANNYFGFDLGYDKANNNIIGSQTYANPQYNGNIEGMVWKSKGDGEKRKYDFGYDAANRLMKADFAQYSGSVFDQSAGINYNVKMGDGSNVASAYDDNGNILRMQQWGWKLTVSGQLDNMRYTYISGSNKLKSVTDFNNDATTKLGDFKTKTTHPQNTAKSALTINSTAAEFDAITDYNYDVNGNLIIDDNKSISSITYNYLNLPSVINVNNGDFDHGGNPVNDVITYVYDATGNKLQKIVDDFLDDVSVRKTTSYINGLVYQNDTLQFTPQEEGRIRFKPATASIAAGFEYDYMLKDHLGNVRMVLTEEQQVDIYPAATLETALVGAESNYYTIDQNKIVLQSSVTGMANVNYPNNNGIPNNNPGCGTGTLCTTDNSTKLYQLNSNENKTGLGITLKVMSGDKIDVFGKSYYHQNNPNPGNNPPNIPIIDLLTGFLNSPGAGAITSTHGGVTPAQINTTQGTAGINSMISSQSSQSSSAPSKPRAFINIIFFDEQFKAVDYRISMVGNNSILKEDHFADLQNLTVPKNGFVYIYCSNETPVYVFFDNIQVVHTRGQILEETHYYPFGLTMVGISSKAAGKFENNYKFNDIEQNSEFDLNMYDAFYRNLDPQIGRFWQVDPKPGFWESPYAIMGNNPILNIDPLGDTIIPVTLKEVTVKANRKYTSTSVLTSCHIQKSDVTLAQELWWYNVTKDLDVQNGQVMPSRSPAIDFFLGSREIEDPDYSPDDIEDMFNTGTLTVGSDGYIKGPTSTAKGGTIPIGFAKGIPAQSLTQRASTLSGKLGKNSITIKTVNGHIRYDLKGSTHGTVKTPHSLRYTRHIGPNGKINMSHPKLPTPMIQQELRLIRNYLKSMK